MTEPPTKGRVQVVPLTFSARRLTLRGTAHVPDHRGPRPTVILCHGFTGHRIETGRLFVTLARRLAERGIASVSFDRQGHGESDGEFFDTTATGDVADTHQVVAQVSELPFVDRSNLHLLGFSLGAVVASAVAAETELPIRSLTLWSPASMFADDARAGGLPGQPNPARVDGGGAYEFEGLELGPGFMEDAATWEPFDRAGGYGGPVRVLHGDQDFIPTRYAERYRDVYGSRAEITIVEDVDHAWNSVWARDLLIRESVDFVVRAAIS